ncbi:tripartite tricarboxylate transporter TctB family protein [Blastococcus sp. MG754426]|uniref:tripartite tricarboxylate transporter TctB family protein n=1 Tax=unclassified Blastococcus TaxID=2619396 RepID=UPI001EEFA316|nr:MULTISPECIES: tripartite tricarboxylate transporter TctB family protein [unclassified Blastococcus]MCF6508477.1 tripartite tricarboxylate transporter TctB family protein [Blastococcus sp. MG754426]MCF6513120.1 tripartite tricarboxylate transporter TctB family protein [Blastococcus sp. MG754427]MCF6735128.1 tripartite tricarboxylate transporter TctB family protein [Blastococcus sp. KM273129]
MTKQLHRLAPLILVVFGAAAMLGARNLGLGELSAPGPGLWPFIVATLLTVTGVVVLFIDDPEDYEPWTRGTLGIGLGLASLAVFIILFETIGFLVSAMLMLLFWLRIFAREPWRWAVPLAVLGALAFHFVFVELLSVPFPDGVVFAPMGS